MEAVRYCETQMNFYRTSPPCIPERSTLQKYKLSQILEMSLQIFLEVSRADIRNIYYSLRPPKFFKIRSCTPYKRSLQQVSSLSINKVFVCVLIIKNKIRIRVLSRVRVTIDLGLDWGIDLFTTGHNYN
jgi:hypothetical protein